MLTLLTSAIRCARGFINQPSASFLSGQNPILLRSRYITYLMMNGRPVTAGLVIIGDEIIKGHVQDSNSCYLAQRLHQIGVDVKTIVTIPDDDEAISMYITDFSKRFTYVVTTGGIGPTHDDITYEAIAKAFGDTTAIHPQLEAICREYFKEKFTDTHKRLATVPSKAELITASAEGGFPVVKMSNVFILPGVPQFLKMAFATLESRMKNPDVSYNLCELYLCCDELSCADTLAAVNREYRDYVSFGSYPEWHSNYYKVHLVLESTDSKKLKECSDKLINSLPDGSIINYEKQPRMNPLQKIGYLIETDKSLAPQLTHSMQTLEEALKRYKPEEICIGFNGGKDCTALLHLWYAMLPVASRQKILSMYIRKGTPFPEVETFIEDTIKRYNLHMMRYEGNIKEQLTELMVQHPQIKAVIMGTRSTDPHGASLTPFQLTDPGWPKLMRINPILSWRYTDVWSFLRGLSLPYCSLYDMGYTSLGSMENTHPNPSLRYTDSNGSVHYRPAYTLHPDNHCSERDGRNL